MNEQQHVIAGCPDCMDSSGIIEGHRYCHYPSAEWQKLWDEGKADVVLNDSTWHIFLTSQEKKYRSILDIIPAENWTRFGYKVAIPSCFNWDIINQIMAFIDVTEYIEHHEIHSCSDKRWNSLTGEYNCAHGSASRHHLIPIEALESVRHIRVAYPMQ